MVITYADTATIRIPMGPLDRVTGSALGTQRDYFGTQGVELVKGVDLALSELHKVLVSRKVLIVVCDGLDKNMDAARGQMVALKARAATDRIETFAILYKGAMSGDGNVISAMIAQTQTVNTAENIAIAIQGILARMADRQYLTFPGFDSKLGLGLSWDGKPHRLILKIDKDDADPVELTLPPSGHLPRAGFPWLVVLLVVVGALLLAVLGVHVFRRKPQPQPLPPPLVDAVVQPPAEPRGRRDTEPIAIADNGIPIVGWLVPRTGPQAYQTFKLRSGITKIGSAPCDIIIDDSFVGSQHCQIHASPEGFRLVDTGSINGSFVNRQRIQDKRDLVDNDEITIGMTNLIFKSLT
ncbi:MAG TPA: FHA domain-containing protein [Kofleriaceae bacterium]|jgi:hypothetical protein|nr:FHA domain-containing protein [Kofleriaceae bacterium]